MVKDKDEIEELDKRVKSDISLHAKDYVALAIAAALETIFLPLVVLIAVVVIIALLIH